MSYIEFVEVKICPACSGRQDDMESCVVCNGWGKIPVTHEISSLLDFHDLLLRVNRENLKVSVMSQTQPIDPKLLQSVRAGAYQNLKADFLYNGVQWWADPEDDAPTWEGEDVLRAFDVVLAEVSAALGINRPATADFQLPAQD